MKLDYLAPLRNGPFARYLAGEGVSMVGTWMQMAAQGWVLSSLTSKSIVFGELQFTAGLPMLVLALAGGSVADRFDKRFILHTTLILQMVCAATVGWLISVDKIEIFHLFFAAGLLGISAAFEVPAVSALVPELVRPEQMSGAIALDRSVFHATRLFGPALGGFLVGRYGASWAYFLNSASFLALIVALLTIPRRARGSAAEEKERAGSMLEGFRYLRTDEPSRAMVLLMAAMTLFISPFLLVTMPLYARVTLSLDPQHLGYLMAASGVGSFSGSLGLLSIPHGHRAFATKIGAAMGVTAMVGLAAAPSFAWAAASIVLLTLGISTSFGIANIVIQERSPNAIRGRVSAVAGLAFFGLIPFSALLISWLTDRYGLRQTMGGCAAIYGLATAWLLAGRKRLATAPDPAPVRDPATV